MKSAAATLTLAVLLGATGNAENPAAELARQDAVPRTPPLALTPTEYAMLAELSAHGGRTLTYRHLLERVWGERGSASLRPMRTIISKLRRKLGDDPANPTYIFTEPRVGFRMLRGHG